MAVNIVNLCTRALVARYFLALRAASFEGASAAPLVFPLSVIQLFFGCWSEVAKMANDLVAKKIQLIRLRALAAIAMTLGILAATIGAAAPAAAVSWTMPDVRGEVLKRAVKTVQETTGVEGLNFRFIDRRNGQDVHNRANWVVCYQVPLAGKKISQKTKRVSLYVKGFNQESCWR